MSHFLDTSLDLASRGFHIIPLVPRDKFPLIAGGCNAGSRDPEQIALWWKRNPDANIGIDCGHSQIIVMDADHGLQSEADFIAWRDRNNLPPTYTVRTGRRPEYGAQMYYRGSHTTQGRKTWTLDGVTGDFKSKGGLVVHPPSVHPDSGEQYEILCDLPLANCPAFILELPQVPRTKDAKDGSVTTDAGLIEGNRNEEMASYIGKVRKQIAGLSADECLILCLRHNENYAKGPMDESEVQKILDNAYRLYPDVCPDPVVRIGGSNGKEPERAKDWRERYHTFDEMSNAPEPTFIIDGFLQKGVISAVAGPVGQRKTIIAANVVHSALTAELLFDHFVVTERPDRVLYLCPEMGLYSFAKRIRNLGLMECVGKNLFCRTMNSEGRMLLSDLGPEELTNALVVVDTAVRFVEGDENSSEDMKVFAEDCFRLMKDGAASVLVLFHSPKAAKDATELTLENAMRGSGDLGAFVSSCWATRLQDPDAPWDSASYLKNVKQRDFESDPFEVKSDKLGRLHIMAQPSANVRLNGKPAGPKGNADGKEDEALQIIKSNPGLSHEKLSALLMVHGIDRSRGWVGVKRRELGLTRGGVKTGEVA